MVEKYIVEPNTHLDVSVNGYYHQYFIGFNRPGNPDFINILKNDNNSYSLPELVEAQNKVVDIVVEDLPLVKEEEQLENCLVVIVPRAKTLESYNPEQLMFKEAIKIALSKLDGFEDGTDCIVRIKDSQTTHILPGYSMHVVFPGLTLNTCQIDEEKIKGREIILIDDLYTKNINMHEDCIQALLSLGAKRVVLYTIGYSKDDKYDLYKSRY